MNEHVKDPNKTQCLAGAINTSLTKGLNPKKAIHRQNTLNPFHTSLPPQLCYAPETNFWKKEKTPGGPCSWLSWKTYLHSGLLLKEQPRTLLLVSVSLPYRSRVFTYARRLAGLHRRISWCPHHHLKR